MSICTLGYYWGTMFAIDNDCWLVNNIQNVQETQSYKGMLDKANQQNFISALPPQALEKAFENLKKFCCQSSSIDDTNCKWYKQAQGYPLSPFLYDHLIDIWLRRLDGIAKFAYGLSGDETGTKRRTFITQAATGGVSPQSKGIADEYKNYRTTKNTINEDSTPSQIQMFLQNYNTPDVSLVDKYNTICEIMKRAYNSIASEKILIDSTAYNKCQKLIERRINNEYTYTKTIMIKTANETMNEVYKTYTMKYFVQEKIMELMDLISQIKSLFSTMVNQAAASKSCTK